MKLYYVTDPMKIMNLRMDTLAQMLNMANVRAGANYMVSSGTQSENLFEAKIMLWSRSYHS